MVENGCPSSLSFTSKNNSLEKITTFCDSSSIIGGASRGNMIAFSNNNKYGECFIPHEPKQKKDITTPSNSKGRRGRPPGSKNKPKPPILIKEDSNRYLKPIIIEIPAGKDIAKAIIEFACRRRVGITVLSGSGSVSDITFRRPLSHIAPTFSITGLFKIISLTGTYMSGYFPPLSPSTIACSSFVIHLSGPLYQVFGGVVGGKVVAASRVVVMASMFKKLEYHRMPFINGNVEEVKEGDPTYNVVINADASGPSGITKSTAIAIPNDMSAFGINSTPLNFQLPPS